MDGRERAQRAVDFEGPDRVPIIHSILAGAFHKHGDELKKLVKLKGHEKTYPLLREASTRFQFLCWKLGLEAARRSKLLSVIVGHRTRRHSQQPNQGKQTDTGNKNREKSKISCRFHHSLLGDIDIMKVLI